MQQEIDRTNYESFLIDYLDGRLSEDLKTKIEQFLIENPDIKSEFSELLKLSENCDPVLFTGKESLYKTPADLIPSRFDSVDEFLIGKIEGDISLEEHMLFNKLINIDETTAREYEWIEKTRLIADKNLIFQNKNELKRSILPFLTKNQFKKLGSFAAAAILLIVFTFIFNNRESNNQDIAHKISENKPTIVAKKNPDAIINKDDNSKFETIQTVSKAKGESESIGKLTIQISKPDSLFNKMSEDNQIIAQAIPKEIKIQNGKMYEQEAEFVSEKKTYTINQYLLRQFRKKMLKESKEEYEIRKFSVWDIVDLGVNQAGKFFGKDMRLIKQYDDDGNIEQLAFNSGILSFDYPINKKQR